MQEKIICAKCFQRTAEDVCSFCNDSALLGNYRLCEVQEKDENAFVAQDEAGTFFLINRFLLRLGVMERDLQEATKMVHTLQRINHPNIPNYIDCLQQKSGLDNYLYLVQEKPAGHTLLTLLQKKSFSVGEVVHILSSVAGALACVHELDPPVVHGEINPGNIVQQSDGTVSLIGFNCVPEELRNVFGNSNLGESVYKSQNQRDEQTTSGDIYSLGVTVGHLLSGQKPSYFRPWKEDRTLPKALLSLLHKMLNDDPNMRITAKRVHQVTLTELSRVDVSLQEKEKPQEPTEIQQPGNLSTEEKTSPGKKTPLSKPKAPSKNEKLTKIKKIKRLKTVTRLSLRDCKEALELANGDYDRALSALLKKKALVTDDSTVPPSKKGYSCWFWLISGFFLFNFLSGIFAGVFFDSNETPEDLEEAVLERQPEQISPQEIQLREILIHDLYQGKTLNVEEINLQLTALCSEYTPACTWKKRKPLVEESPEKLYALYTQDCLQQGEQEVVDSNVCLIAGWGATQDGFNNFAESNPFFDDGVGFFEKSCAQGNQYACAELALIFEQREAKPDPQKALDMYLKSCSTGIAWACGRIGWIYNQEMLASLPKTSGEVFFILGCELGDGESCRYYGDLNPLSRREYYEMACRKGSPVGCNSLAISYKDSEPINEELSLYNYELACQAKEKYSCFNLGSLYSLGILVSKDLAVSREYYATSCRQGNWQGCYNAGEMMLTGEGGEKQIETGEKFMLRACHNDNYAACHFIAYAYDHGQDVEQSIEKALKYYQIACDQKIALSCNNLGVIYYGSPLIENDKTLARGLFQLACDLGDELGCKNLVE